ncbi:MAG: 3-keto-5-aminohexanoate cleavage protein [Porticoccaceae bacterium]|nr:3-keto-5-aminohexanoate cleavage protein [Porticoccaceae bacterium]
MSSLTPMMIAVAPNGARTQKTDHQALPITPAELAETAVQCRDAGACMIHLHVRDAQGGHSLDVGAYRLATTAVRDAVGQEMIIQVTTEAVGIYNVDQQIQTVKQLKPEAVSLAIRELCADSGDEVKGANFFSWLQRERISPQYILYSLEDVLRFNSLRQRGIIPGDRVSVLYVLGRYSDTGTSSPEELMPMFQATDAGVVWSVCGFGAAEGACMLLAADLGGHARVGFENNMQLANGKLALDNSALVAQLASGIGGLQRRIASCSEARVFLGL